MRSPIVAPGGLQFQGYNPTQLTDSYTLASASTAYTVDPSKDVTLPTRTIHLVGVYWDREDDNGAPRVFTRRDSGENWGILTRPGAALEGDGIHWIPTAADGTWDIKREGGTELNTSEISIAGVIYE